MFGYVRIHKPELKMAEYELYQGIYCSLCKQLGKHYGFLSRMTLSYDFTFLAMFRMAMDDQCVGFKRGRCSFNPLKKRTCCCDNEHLRFAADAAVILTYYKLKDNIADQGLWSSLTARLLLPFASHARKKAARLRPDLDGVIGDCMREQAALESAHTASVDAAAEPTARMLSALALDGVADPVSRRVLERFGYCLGRWIYLVDAADDLRDDLEHRNYNPFLLSRGWTKDTIGTSEQTVGELLPVLNACLAECTAAYHLLTISRFDGILRNILEQGMPAVQQQVLAQKGNKHERQRSI